MVDRLDDFTERLMRLRRCPAIATEKPKFRRNRPADMIREGMERVPNRPKTLPPLLNWSGNEPYPGGARARQIVHITADCEAATART
jgi:hypothetical protein